MICESRSKPRCGDFYILSHTYKHYVRAGSGLRSLLDVYVFLRSKPDLDRGYPDAELLKPGLVDFEEKMRRLSGKVFTDAALNDTAREDLKYIISSGYGGLLENKMQNKPADDLGNDDSVNARDVIELMKFILPDAQSGEGDKQPKNDYELPFIPLIPGLNN